MCHVGSVRVSLSHERPGMACMKKGLHLQKTKKQKKEKRTKPKSKKKQKTKLQNFKTSQQKRNKKNKKHFQKEKTLPDVAEQWSLVPLMIFLGTWTVAH